MTIHVSACASERRPTTPLDRRTRHRVRPARRRRSVALAGLCLVNACDAGWQREEVAPRGELPRRQQVQVWTGQRSRVLHAVRLGPDSLTGVPFHLPPDCDRCRVALPRAAVDSIRLGNQERGALRSLALGYVAVGAAAVLLYLSVGTD